MRYSVWLRIRFCANSRVKQRARAASEAFQCDTARSCRACEVVGEIGPGVLLYLGITGSDGPEEVQDLAKKVFCFGVSLLW